MTPSTDETRPSPAPRAAHERGRLAIALELARRAPALARIAAELLVTLAALAVVAAVLFVAPDRLSAALVGALLGGTALLGRRGRRGKDRDAGR